MLYRDGQRSIFPRVTATEAEVKEARKRDLLLKQKHQQLVNAGKYKSDSEFTVGEHVLVRNYHRQRKFDPIFLPEDFVVVEISQDERCLTVERVSDGSQLKRHPDDLKKFTGSHNGSLVHSYNPEREILHRYIQKFAQLTSDMENCYESVNFQNIGVAPQPPINTRMTRSSGQSLAWNPAMNAGDVLLAAGGGNDQELNMLGIQEHWV